MREGAGSGSDGARGAARPPEELEQLLARLALWNRGQPCGAPALRRRLEEFYHLQPLPAVRTIIGHTLRRNEMVNW